jgi:hypothetical protein
MIITMDTASKHFKLLENDYSHFGLWLKELILKFPLAIEELLKRAMELGITSVEKIISNRNRNKYAEMLTSFLNEGRIAATSDMVRISNTEKLQENLELAFRFVQAKIYTRNLRVDPLYAIPASEFDLMKRTF